MHARRLARSMAVLTLAALAAAAEPALAAAGAACRTSNGCGPQGGGRVVRDSLGTIDFTPACDAHDACYGTQGRSQEACDEAFLADMKGACRRAFPTVPLGVAQCYYIATDYYAAVWALGGSAYEEAQACLTDALKREEAGIRGLTLELRNRIRQLRPQAAAAKTAAERVKPLAAMERTNTAGDLGALLDAKNELGVYLVTLRAATPPADERLAHGRKVADLDAVFSQLKQLHDGAAASARTAEAGFRQAPFEAKVDREAARVFTARLDAIDADLQHGQTVLDSARVGVAMTPRQSVLDEAARIASTAQARLGALVSFVQLGTINACAAELAPLRDARSAVQSALRAASPLHLKGLGLVGKAPAGAAPPRPPPPPR